MYLLHFDDKFGVSEQVLQCEAYSIVDAIAQAKAHFGMEQTERLEFRGAYTVDAYPHNQAYMESLYQARSHAGYPKVVWQWSLTYRTKTGARHDFHGEVTAKHAVDALNEAHTDAGTDRFDPYECTLFDLNISRKDA